MGLDQYAYRRRQDAVNNDEDIQLMYWRKHPNLQGFMENLWRIKNPELATEGVDFNCVYVDLNLSDILELENSIKEDKLPHTEGFFFGASSEHHKQSTLEFIDYAKEALSEGDKVLYYSWW